MSSILISSASINSTTNIPVTYSALADNGQNPVAERRIMKTFELNTPNSTVTLPQGVYIPAVSETSHFGFSPPPSTLTSKKEEREKAMEAKGKALRSRIKELSDLETCRKTTFCVVSTCCHTICMLPFCFCFGAAYCIGNRCGENPKPVYDEDTWQRAVCPMDCYDQNVSTDCCLTCCPDTDFLKAPERQEMIEAHKELNDVIQFEMRPSK